MTIGYIRVSTEDQSLSMKAQRDKIEQYCALNDLVLDRIEEEALSGKSIEGRPALNNMLLGLKEGDNVVVVKLDRLARNTIETLEMAELFEKKKAHLHSITEKLDTKSPIGKFFFTLIAALAEMERATIAERTRTVLQSKKSRGEKTGGGIPYGFTVQVKSGVKVLTQNLGEQKVIAEIKALRAQGKSLAEITRILNSQGHHRGRRWYPMQVKRVL